MNQNIKQIKGVFLFIVITLVIHFSFRYWANSLHFAPIPIVIQKVRMLISNVVVDALDLIFNFLGLQYIIADNTFTFDNNNYLAIHSGCSGFKQMLQAVLLFVFFPGKINHKLWFIPLSVLLMFVANLMRLVPLAYVVYYIPEYFYLFHDYLLRFIFYLIIFLLWLWWYTSFNKSTKKT